MRVDSPENATINFVVNDKQLPPDLAYLDVDAEQGGARIKHRCNVGNYKEVTIHL